MRKYIIFLLVLMVVVGTATAGGWEESDSRIYIYRLWEHYAELGQQVNEQQGILRDEFISKYNASLYRTRETFWLLEQEVINLHRELDELEGRKQNLDNENRDLRDKHKELQDEILKIKEENRHLREQVQKWDDAEEVHLMERLEEKGREIAVLKEEIEDRDARNRTMIAEIEELEEEKRALLEITAEFTGESEDDEPG